MFFPPLGHFVPVALTLFSGVAAAASVRRATICNGHSELCNKSYGNVSFVGAHDSYAVGDDSLTDNQDYDVTQQLKDGIRMLQMQAHNNNSTIELCHTSCKLQDGGTLENYLTKVKTWMDANTNDVVTLLIVNIDDLPASQFGDVFESVGLDKISYVPPESSMPASSWPTLGSMIDSGTRLVTFLDNSANGSPPYLIDEFTNVWETPFDVTDEFDCSVNRTKGDSLTQMYLINHFFDTLLFNVPVPDVGAASVTNNVTGKNSLGAQVHTCEGQHDRAPNYLLVDFYEFGGGSVFQVAANINGVIYDPQTPIATPRATSSIASSSGGSSSSSSGSSLPARASKSRIAYLVVALGILVGASSV